MIDVLTLLGNISGIKPSFLGLTLLAAGNSVGDLMANLAISKMGLGELAVIGCTAGPLFNLLLGLAISLTKITAVHGSQPFSLEYKPFILPIIFLIFLLIASLTKAITSCCSKFQL